MKQEHRLFCGGEELLLDFAISLTSALQKIHEYTYTSTRHETYSSRFYGDLKPSRIFIYDKSLPDANNKTPLDFKLSVWNPIQAGQQDTQTMSYRAPEYVPQPSSTWAGKASDIWSLGCIFAEFIAWVVEGPAGVRRFRVVQDAETRTPHNTLEAALRFLRGIESANPAVADGPASPDNTRWRNIVGLVLRMLDTNPSLRPTAAQTHQLLKSWGNYPTSSNVLASQIEEPANIEYPVERAYPLQSPFNDTVSSNKPSLYFRAN